MQTPWVPNEPCTLMACAMPNVFSDAMQRNQRSVMQQGAKLGCAATAGDIAPRLRSARVSGLI